jgi:hypothetical protein
MKTGRLFNSNKSGLIEIFFSEAELSSNIELLVLVRKLCDAIITSHAQNPQEVDQNQVERLMEHSAAASDLIQKLLLDSEVELEKPTPEGIH